MSRNPGDPPRPPRRNPEAPRPPRPPERPSPPIDAYDLAEIDPEPIPVPVPPTTEPATFQASAPRRTTRKTRAVDSEPPPATGGPGWSERILLGSVGTGHLAMFCRQFAQYTEAGIPLLKSLSSLEKQFARTALGPVLGRIHASVKTGDSLTEAMGREPDAFDKLMISSIRVAEARGGVPEALRRMADHYESRQTLIRQARSASIYPIIVLTIAAGVVALITMFVLPSLFSALETKQDSLPGPTRLLMGFSKFMQGHGWWALPATFVGGGFALWRLYKTSGGKAMIDSLLIRVPVFGKLLRLLDTSRFARTLGVLLDAGVAIPESLDLTAEMMQMAPYHKAVTSMRESVDEGSDLVEAVRDSGRFDMDVLARVEAGEESGKLPESLDKLADDVDEQVTYMVKNLGTLVQPLIFFFLGGIVLFILLAVFMFYANTISQLAAPGGGI